MCSCFVLHRTTTFAMHAITECVRARFEWRSLSTISSTCHIQIFNTRPNQIIYSRIRDFNGLVRSTPKAMNNICVFVPETIVKSMHEKLVLPFCILVLTGQARREKKAEAGKRRWRGGHSEIWSAIYWSRAVGCDRLINTALVKKFNSNVQYPLTKPPRKWW